MRSWHVSFISVILFLVILRCGLQPGKLTLNFSCASCQRYPFGLRSGLLGPTETQSHISTVPLGSDYMVASRQQDNNALQHVFTELLPCARLCWLLEIQRFTDTWSLVSSSLLLPKNLGATREVWYRDLAAEMEDCMKATEPVREALTSA